MSTTTAPAHPPAPLTPERLTALQNAPAPTRADIAELAEEVMRVHAVACAQAIQLERIGHLAVNWAASRDLTTAAAGRLLRAVLKGRPTTT